MRRLDVKFRPEERWLPWQTEVAPSMSRFNVLDKGRRTGGTALGVDWVIEPLLYGFSAAWVCLTEKHLIEVWSEVSKALKPLTMRKDDRMRRIELSTGGVFEMWSAASEITMRGRKYVRIVVSEAAWIDSLRELFEQELRPTIAQYEGEVLFESSPNGVNDFKDLWDFGQDPAKRDLGWRSWQIPTTENPLVPASEIANMREVMTEDNFRQEILAEFVIRSGAGFGMFKRSIHAANVIPYDPHLPVSMGVDFGYRTSAYSITQHRMGTYGPEGFIIGEAEIKETETEPALIYVRDVVLPKLHIPANAIEVIGCDPAGNSRNPQTGLTDVSIVRKVFPGARVKFSMDAKHRSPEWRAQQLRNMLKSATGIVRLWVSSLCVLHCSMFEKARYPEHREGQPEKNELVKDGITDHMRDALGYDFVNVGILSRDYGQRVQL